MGANLFQRNTTGEALIPPMPSIIRAVSSATEPSLMWCGKVGDIFEKAHSIRLRQETDT
ncbi:MAG: hypothetical protein HZC43_05840 [Nitrosomonadales bacterium]|nr:hypothetical protein [Nitrosomonadales bacterium]